MMAATLAFARPRKLEATVPAEIRLGSRDAVRLLISNDNDDEVLSFRALPELLQPGDLLVVNESQTVPASLPALAPFGEFRLNLSTHYGGPVWVAEPRWDYRRPGPLPFSDGDSFRAAGLRGRILSSFPGTTRLRFVRLDGDVPRAMAEAGEPIRYGYVNERYGLEAYQTIFGRVAGSAEMPSAGRPFSGRLLDRLRSRGVNVAPVLLHTGVSSLETADWTPGALPVYPEPFRVPGSTVHAIERARCAGHRVIAVGTTVVRALESALGPSGLRPAQGFTRAFITPRRPPSVADALLTGLHESGTTHLAMLESWVGRRRIAEAYRAAVAAGLLWHEFGDSHLLWRPGSAPVAAA